MAVNQGDTKQQIREAVRERRANSSALSRQRARHGLTEQLSSLVTARGAQSVSCYLPLPGEPDPSGFIAWAQEHSVEVFLPISREDRNLDWARLGDKGTRRGLHGIQEPIGERLPSTILSSVTLLLIPACAVDLNGMRLGWGLGYYDRLLASLTPRPPAFAIVHDDELVPRLPAAAHDVPVHGIVTPTQIRLFSSEPG